MISSVEHKVQLQKNDKGSYPIITQALLINMQNDKEETH